jgi:hypothetical protein
VKGWGKYVPALGVAAGTPMEEPRYLVALADQQAI